MTLLFSENLLHALSWTFVHSLWMGLLLTALGALVIQGTKRSSPALRYALLTTLFFSFIIAIVVAFVTEWNGYGLKPDHITAEAITLSKPLTFIQAISSWFDQLFTNYGAWMIMAWFLVFLVKAIKMVHDLSRVHHLKNAYIIQPSAEWQQRFEQLRHQLGVSAPVRLLESVLVKVPVVMGHLKPVILVPAGIFSNLPANEIEAVLLHELAHIRRNDYLVNFIQRITEMIFFFNPGLLWVSSLLRTERENCCDDMVISRTNDKEQYVNALIRFREHALQTSSYALPLPGQASTLVQRVSRIVYSKNRSLSRFEGVFATVSIAICIALVTYHMKSPLKTAHPSFAALVLNSDTLATTPVFEATEIATTIENKAKPTNSSTLPSTRTQAGNRQVKPQQTQLPPVESIPEKRENASLHPYDQALEKQRKQASEFRVQADKQRVEADKQRKEAEIFRAEAEQQRKIAAIQRQEADELRKQADIQRIEADRQRVEADKQREEANKMRLEAEKQRKQAEIDRLQAEKYRAAYSVRTGA